jgi:hypothetical protein
VRNFSQWFFDLFAQFCPGREFEIFLREIRQRWGAAVIVAEISHAQV